MRNKSLYLTVSRRIHILEYIYAGVRTYEQNRCPNETENLFILRTLDYEGTDIVHDMRLYEMGKMGKGGQ